MLEKPFLKKLLSPRFLTGATAMGMAALYIAYRHVDWKTKPDAKKRMLVSHLVFWPLCGLGLKSMHLSFGLKETWQQVAGIVASSGVVAGGFEGSFQLARKLFPKQNNQQVQPLSGMGLISTRQAYQQGLNAGYKMAFSQVSPMAPVAQQPLSVVFPGYRPALFR